MVSPEDLSVEHSRELARNRTDMRFMEDDEEKAYSWIRFWCEDELYIKELNGFRL